VSEGVVGEKKEKSDQVEHLLGRESGLSRARPR
jgi:hypothetical protein